MVLPQLGDLTLTVTVNGRPHRVQAAPETPLLYVLRTELRLNAAYFGCGLGRCGACTVHVDGQPVRSCEVPVGDLGGAEVTTLEGLGTIDAPHPIQQAFLDEQAAQCGYCIPGMIMSAAALLDQNSQPSEAEIRGALAGNLCRCGTHTRILRAVQRAASSTTPAGRQATRADQPPTHQDRLPHEAGGLTLTFSLTAANQSGVSRGEPTATASGELAETKDTPTAEPGLVATPTDQAQQDFQTRDVSSDTVDSWLHIDADGMVTVFSGKVELGTGLQTALAQIVAEELDVACERVRLIMGDTGRTPNQGGTVGSKSLQVAGPVLRRAAAEARLVLLTRAAERLGVPVDDLQPQDGVISHVNDARCCIPYGELVGEPFNREVTGTAPEKPPSSYKVVGQPVRRIDLPAKLTGGEAFVQDVRLEGMLHGRVVRPHLRTMDGVGATLVSCDDSTARAVLGVVAVVRSGDFIGVVAEREEQAIRAAAAIEATWAPGEPLVAHDRIHELLRTMPAIAGQGGAIVDQGDVAGALAGAAQVLEATYNFPAQAHAMMGPSCAVADMRPDGVTVYTQSQNVFSLRDTLADLLGIAPEQVRVIFREGSGCYGHSGYDDAAADAVILSRAVGRPVRVQWSRADELAWEPKSPPMTMDVRGGLDATGNVVAWDYEVWTPTHTTRPRGQAAGVLAGQLIDPPAAPLAVSYGGGDRNAPVSYTFPNNRVTVHWVETPPLRPSAMRSLGGLANTTANESFVDELAAAAGADPVEFRLRHLDDPRAINVIRAAAEAARWETRPSGPRTTLAASDGPLRGRGIAFARYETAFAYVAVVAEVEVDPADGTVRVTRAVAGHDCGLIVNPDGLRNQIEGNVIQGISRALKEEVTWDDHQVTSLDWSTYRILTFPEAPAIETVLIDRAEEPALGAGEPAICPAAAAIGNAIYDATGARLRTVPFTPERVLTALAVDAKEANGRLGLHPASRFSS